MPIENATLIKLFPVSKQNKFCKLLDELGKVLPDCDSGSLPLQLWRLAPFSLSEEVDEKSILRSKSGHKRTLLSYNLLSSDSVTIQCIKLYTDV